MSVHLMVSRKSFDNKCEKVAKSLQNAGVATALVIPGITTIGRDKMEQACMISLPYGDYGAGPKHKESLAKLWSNVSADLNLTCAFLQIDSRFAGCILNFLRPSACDFSKQAPLRIETKRSKWLWWSCLDIKNSRPW